MTFNTLNYRPSNSAVYYTPARRIDPAGTLLGFAVAAIGVILGALFYAKLQPVLHSLYLRMGEVVVGALGLGALTMLPVRYGKLQIKSVAVLLGVVLALIALYTMWLAWLHGLDGAQLGYGRLMTHPIFFFRLIRFVNRFGTWSYPPGVPVRGIVLAIFWIAEAAAFLTCGALFPLQAIADDDPTCQGCGSTCKVVRPIPRFSVQWQDALIAVAESRDFSGLIRFEPPETDHEPQLSLKLLTCRKCGQTNTLTVNRIEWVRAQRARQKLSIRPLVPHLLVTSAEAEQLATVFEEIKKSREPAEVPTPVEEHPVTESEAADVGDPGDQANCGNPL